MKKSNLIISVIWIVGIILLILINTIGYHPVLDFAVKLFMAICIVCAGIVHNLNKKERKK